MKKETQHVEGLIKGCKRDRCSCSCCDDGTVEEWAIEFFAFHERMKDYLLSIGIELKFEKDVVKFKNCSDGEKCRFLAYSPNKRIDPRPIDCKVFPYIIDWNSIDFDKKIVNLYYWDLSCPLLKRGELPKGFKKEVKKIIERDFALLFYGAAFKLIFHDKSVRKKLK